MHVSLVVVFFWKNNKWISPRCDSNMTPESVFTRSDAVIDPWLTALWDKVYALYPSLADVIPLSEYEPWVLTHVDTLIAWILCWVCLGLFTAGFLWQAPSNIYVPLPEREGWHSKQKLGSTFAHTGPALPLQTSVEFKSNGDLTLSGCQAYWVWYHWIQHWVSTTKVLAIKINMHQYYE